MCLLDVGMLAINDSKTQTNSATLKADKTHQLGCNFARLVFFQSAHLSPGNFALCEWASFSSTECQHSVTIRSPWPEEDNPWGTLVWGQISVVILWGSGWARSNRPSYGFPVYTHMLGMWYLEYGHIQPINICQINDIHAFQGKAHTDPSASCREYKKLIKEKCIYSYWEKGLERTTTAS